MTKTIKKIINKVFNPKTKGLFFKKYLPLFVVSMAILLLPFVVIEITQQGKISHGIILSSIPVGGKTPQEALGALYDKFKPVPQISLIFEDKTYTLPIDDKIVKYNFEASVNKAYFQTRTGNIFYDFFQKISLFRNPKHIGVDLTLDELLLREKLTGLIGDLEITAQNPSLSYKNEEILVDPGKEGRMIDDKYLLSLIGQKLSFADSGSISIPFSKTGYVLTSDEITMATAKAQKYVSKSIKLNFNDYSHTLSDSEIIGFINPKEGYNESQISVTIAKIASEIDKPAQDSVFIFEEGSVKEFTPSKDGYTLDKNALREEIIDKLNILLDLEKDSEEITLPVLVSKPKIQNKDVNNLGIDTLLGRGTSKFVGSIANRVYNISLASSKFKSVLVAPDETFSFNAHLGDVSTETGYKQAYIIKEGKTILGDGGGVCQVSTTFFRALLDAGLPITERQAHAYRVGYYEQDSPPGLDATVYSPHPDLKFKNNTPKYILIQATMDPKKYTLVFEIYGTSDGRIATVTKPKISKITPPPDDAYIDDPTLPVGTTKQIEHKSSGAKVSFDYQVVRDEKVIYKKTFYSNYQPWQAVYLRGTKPN